MEIPDQPFTMIGSKTLLVGSQRSFHSRLQIKSLAGSLVAEKTGLGMGLVTNNYL